MGTPNTKNLGLVKAIHVGVNPPLNTKMLWYNTNPSENRHFYFDVIDIIWKPLIGGTGTGTSNTFIDSNTVDFYFLGTDVSADVKISSQSGNVLQATTGGLYAPDLQAPYIDVFSGTQLIITQSDHGKNHISSVITLNSKNEIIVLEVLIINLQVTITSNVPLTNIKVIIN